jgi:hypothetical protein
MLSTSINNKLKKAKQEKDRAEEEDFIIKSIQEIAYDYHVRIFKAAWGNLIINNERVLPRSNKIKSYGCFDMDLDNTNISESNIDAQFEYADTGNIYFINFRVLGKRYLAYGNNISIAWFNVIKKAKDINKRYFSGHIDK